MNTKHPQSIAGATATATATAATTTTTTTTSATTTTTTTATTNSTAISTPNKNKNSYHVQLNRNMTASNPTQQHYRITRSRARLKEQQSPEACMNNSSLEHFTNTQFSRSFNSLILDDSKEDIKRTTINKSPPFNVKQDFFNSDGIDTYLDEEITDADEEDEEDEEDDDDDFITQGDHSLNISKSKRINMECVPTPQRPNLEDMSRTSNSTSSMKRSSKYFNLSIDSTSTLKVTPRSRDVSPNSIPTISQASQRPQIEVDNIDSLSEIESSVIEYREGTPSNYPSPVITRTPAENNQFKRPHKLVSQSPSPSSNRIFTTRPSTTSLFSSNEDLRSSSDSPSKLKGFKMFKNANKDAVMSPHRRPVTTPEKPRFSTMFDKIRTNKLRRTNQSPYTDSPSTSTPLLVSNITTTIENRDIPCQPSQNFEDYVDELDFDSPSKTTRKLSGSNSISNNNISSIIIYHEKPLQYLSSPNHIHSQPIEFPQQTDPDLKVFDDKENKLPSYKFVKPLQAAFNSSGLIKKNNVTHIPDRKLPPETPVKRNPLMLLNPNHKTTTTGKHTTSFAVVEEEHTDNSIEVGRNQSYDGSFHSSQSSSFFRIPQSSQSENVSQVHELDIELSDVDMNSVPETPTKNHPVANKSFTKDSYTPPLSRYNNNNLIATSVCTNVGVDHEPCTPTNLQFLKGNKGKQPQKHSLLHDATIIEDDSVTTYLQQKLSQTENESETRPDLYIPSKIDDHLIKKFGMKNIKTIGIGEFSIAYECIIQDQKLAIKRSKRPIIGKLERKAIQREIDALRALTSVNGDNLEEEEEIEGKEYLVYFIEAWDFNNYYYIMTEFCEGGTLFDFLEQNKHYRIDEFRIWKILIEILLGLRFIHSKNYLHLDLKPANIFITFEGSLKIGDFGLATKLPILEKDFDLEGDRNYIAPELINDKIYTPFADIFCLGLIILEIAANIILPDNGTPWRKLRSGDLSDAGQLSSDNISMFLNHQVSVGGESKSCLSNSSTTNVSSTQSLTINSSGSNLFTMVPPNAVNNSTSQLNPPATMGNSSNGISKGSVRDLIPPWAPEFLTSGDSMNLDRLVNKMLRPNPFDRPSASNILEMEECIIIENRRKAGATIFEGEFGPPDD